ncbi:mule transposase protein [Fusarium langsethiae]|uniref:Mule transposase protein n=1 Tax=Fusarium langsethiae TaxID=179993 RepID=A0A0M9EMW0_FUSLA|nr:mule transposase protein [Fusarium langsethiae]
MQEGRATFSQPVTSPVQVSLLPNVSAPGEEQCEQHDLSDASSRYNAVETIPNPPIPGDPAPSVDALFARVNSFAKTRGFSIIKAHSMIRPGQRSRYVLQCDRYGAPRPGRGAGIRKRKSRKTGCLWKIIAEALPENGFQWTLQHFPDAEHHHHNHNPSTDAAAHPVHRRLTSPVKATIQSSSRRVGIRARDIGSQFLTNGVRTLLDRYSTRTPDVVITDFDDQMKKALGVEFQDAQ